MIGTTQETKQYLREANTDIYGRETWNQLYGNVGLQAQEAASNLTYDYSQAMAEAYATSLQSRSDIAGTALGTGYKERLYSDLDVALEAAFNKQQQSYLEGMQSIAEGEASAREAIDQALTRQAENVNKLESSTYGYLESLWNAYQEGDTSVDFTNPFWSRYLINTAGEGEPVNYELMKEADIRNNLYSYNPETGRSELTELGIDFYDQMLNIGSELGSEKSFATYLQGADKDLYEWAYGQTPYDYAPGITGITSNLTSFKSMVGLASDDATYSYIEHLSGIKAPELNAAFDDLNTKLETFRSSGNADDYKSIQATVDNIKTISQKLKIDTELLNEMGVNSWDEVSNEIQNAFNNYSEAKAGRQSAESAAGTTGLVSIGAGGAGAVVAALTISNPVVGAIAALAFLAIGITAGTIGATAGADVAKERREDEKAALNDYNAAKSEYLNTIATLAAFGDKLKR